MKYVRIEENTQARVKVVMEELVEEARGLIYQNGCTERDKDYCNNLLNDVMGAIVKVIKDYGLDTCAVTVWNKDTVNPGNIDRKLIDVMWDYRAEAQFIIKRKMRGYNLMNRVHKLVDYVNYLIWSADRTAELELEHREEVKRKARTAELLRTAEFLENYEKTHETQEKTETQEVQNEDKTEETTSEAPDTTAVTEPQTQEEYVQPAWKRILEELDRRREGDKVCVDIS